MKLATGQRGTTLIELMVGLMVGAMVALAAVEIAGRFTSGARKQQELIDAQQTERVVHERLSAAIRDAGFRFVGPMDANGCAGSGTYYPFQWSNDNAYTDAKAAFDSNRADVESASPDWFRVILFEHDSMVWASRNNGANLVVDNTAPFHEGDWFVVVSKDPTHKSCVRYVTGIDNAGGNKGAGGGVQHNQGAANCANPPPGHDECMKNMAFPAQVFRLSPRSVAYRVDTTNPRTPKLMASFSPPGQPAQWHVMALDVEDLQISVVLDDGTVCGSKGNSVDDPSLCDPMRIKAVRVTTVVRTSQTIPGVANGYAGGYEDELLSANWDSYLRRVLSWEEQLRNM